jgi:hypothetical protein
MRAMAAGPPAASAVLRLPAPARVTSAAASGRAVPAGGEVVGGHLGEHGEFG